MEVRNKRALLIKLIILIAVFVSILLFLGRSVREGGFHIIRFNEKLQDTGSFYNIESIDVNAVSSSVKIEEYDGSTTEYEFFSYTDNNNPAVEVADNTLKLVQKARVGVDYFGSRIVIRVPKSDKLSYYINSTSGSISLNAKSLGASLKTVSGYIKVYSGGGSIFAATTSGSVKVLGPFENLDLSTVSGSIKAVSDENTKAVSAETTSGSIKISLPSECSYTMSYSTQSGSIRDDYHGISFDKRGNTTYGSKDNAMQIKASTVSGSIKLCDFSD